MKPHAKTIARGLPRWDFAAPPVWNLQVHREISRKRPFPRPTHALAFLSNVFRKISLEKKDLTITCQTSHERGGTLNADFSPRSRRKVSALFEKIISRSRSIIAPSERRAGCLLERIVVLEADNYHFAAKLVWNLCRRNTRFHSSRFNLTSQLVGLTACSSTAIVIYFCYKI